MPYISSPYTRTCRLTSVINISCQCGTFVTTCLTHHNHPKSIVHIMVHPWWCTLHTLGQRMTCTHHYSITHSIFAVLEILYTLLIHSFPHLPIPGNHWYLYCLHIFFSGMSYSGNHTVCIFFTLVSSLSNMYLSFCYAFSWFHSSYLCVYRYSLFILLQFIYIFY